MRTRLRVTGAVMALGCAFALLPLWAAHAEPSTGEVTVSLPSRIVLDGEPVPVSVATTGTGHSLDVVAVGLYTGAEPAAMGGVAAGRSGGVGPGTLAPGTVVGRATVVTASCDDASSGQPSSGQQCQVDADGKHFRVVDGLTRHDSAPVVAKYGSKVALTVRRSGAKVRWTAHVTRYDGSRWVGWSAVPVRIGSHLLQSDARGVARLSTRTKKAHAGIASVAGTATVWPATSATVTSAAATTGTSAGPATAAEQAAFRKALEDLAG